MKLTIPTWLTLARIAMIPVLVVVYYLDYRWTNIAATAIFVFASLTDWLDGWIARRWHQYSAFGAFLDPVADKLMVAGALLLLVQLGRADAILAFVIIGREIAISALREWMAQIGKSASVAVSFAGKLKTTMQMIAIMLLLYYQPVAGFNTEWWGTLLIWVAALLTLGSMLYYLKMAALALHAQRVSMDNFPSKTLPVKGHASTRG